MHSTPGYSVAIGFVTLATHLSVVIFMAVAQGVLWNGLVSKLAGIATGNNSGRILQDSAGDLLGSIFHEER
jgi:hypothetical protein